MTRDRDDVVRAYAGPLVLVEMYQAALKEAGIESRVVGTELAAGFGSALPGSVELWVHRLDLPNAEAVIEREARAEVEGEHDRPRARFPRPTDDPKPPHRPDRREPYVNPNF
ncbi:MAG: DUF2007 domain-containing protein [Planctomycetes bacterium]|nr:DUF2007 domain-containing protein [Planctomycetota bacterium]